MQQVSSPPPQKDEATLIEKTEPLQSPHFHTSRLSHMSVFAFLALICLLTVFFAGLSLQTAASLQTHVTRVGPTRTVGQTRSTADVPPLLVPGASTASVLKLSTEQSVVYEQTNGIYVTSTLNGTAQQITTPGYVYNRAIPPIVTLTGQLLYSGDGLWLTDLFNGTAKQIATLPPRQVITSLALSSDGSTIAWSTEPIDGIGNATIYAGPLEESTVIYTHDATDCPCYRVFSFLPESSSQDATSDTMLLLTDDRGDHHSVQYGLWTLNLADVPLETAQPLLDGSVPQGPLSLSPDGKTLLYSTYQGVVPTPNNGSVPSDVQGLNYANSISVANLTVSGSFTETKVAMNLSQSIVPAQRDLSNDADYHWITTPIFSADGHTLVYVEFSSDVQTPFTRHSALYMVHISNTGNHLTVQKPQLMETANAPYIELGTWLSSSVVTFYANQTLYALDINNGAITPLAQTKTYARAIAVWS